MKIYLQKYKQIRKLGQGGFGKVFLVRDIHKNQDFALKICDKKLFQTLEMKQAFENQIKCLKYFSCLANCQNIIKFQNLGEDDKFLYIVTEYCDRGDLRSQMKKLPNKIFTIQQATQILAQVINGLEMIHSLRYMHRDIKLDNILLKNQNEKKIAKICDFGFSKKCYSSNRTTIAGTLNYMAPEVLLCDTDEAQGYNYGVDMWSFGVLFFYMLNACQPFSISKMNFQKGQALLCLALNFSYRKATQNINHAQNNKQMQELQDIFSKIFNPDPKKRITFYQIRFHPLFKPFFPNIKDKTKKLYEAILGNVLLNFMLTQSNDNKKVDIQFKIVNYEIKKIQFLEDCFKTLWKAPFLDNNEKQILKYQSLKYFLIQYEALLILLNHQNLAIKYPLFKWRAFCSLQNFITITKNLQEKLIHIFNGQYIPTYQYCQQKIESLVQIYPKMKSQLTKNAREDELSDEFKIIYRDTLNQIFFDKLKMYKKTQRLHSYYLCVIAYFCNSYHHGIFDRLEDIKLILTEFLYGQHLKEAYSLNLSKLTEWLQNCKYQQIFMNIITKINQLYFK